MPNNHHGKHRGSKRYINNIGDIDTKEMYYGNVEQGIVEEEEIKAKTMRKRMKDQ